MLNRVDAVFSTPTIGSLTGLVKINPLLAFVFSLCLFSLAGIPPLLGFYAKFGIFQVSINSGFFYNRFVYNINKCRVNFLLYSIDKIYIF